MMEQATNNFIKGMLLDTHPMVTGNDVMTDCLNGTIVTMSGNEVVLLNDMGNRRVDNAFLPPGYEPVGMKEYGGIIYVAAYNPITNHSQVGSFPSPERKLSPNDAIDDLQASFDFGDFYAEENIEFDENYSLKFLKNDSFLIPLTKDLNLHVGDKFTVYAAGLSKMESRITNYNNVIEIDGKKYPLTPKNREFTLQLGILNSQNEFVDITKSLARWKKTEKEKEKSYIDEELILNDGDEVKTIKVDSGIITIKNSPLDSEELYSLEYSIDNETTWYSINDYSIDISIEGQDNPEIKLRGYNCRIEKIKRIYNEWEIIDYTNESELYQFNDGYFIPDEFDVSDWGLTIKDKELIQERQALSTNTYAYKLVGPLYLKVILNHVQSCDYNININIDEEQNITLVNNSTLYYNCPDGSNINFNSGLIGEYYTKDIPNFDEVTLLKLDITLDNYITTNPIETIHTELDLTENLIKIADKKDGQELEYIYKSTSSSQSLTLENENNKIDISKSRIIVKTENSELNSITLSSLDNLNFVSIQFECIETFNITKLENNLPINIQNYTYIGFLENIEDTSNYNQIIITTNLSALSIRAIWFCHYEKFFICYSSLIDDSNNTYIFEHFNPNSIYKFTFDENEENEENDKLTYISFLDKNRNINYELEFDSNENLLFLIPDKTKKSILMKFHLMPNLRDPNFTLYKVKENSYVKKHTLNFDINECYNFLLKASSQLELISIKGIKEDESIIEILEEHILLYNPPMYYNTFSFNIDNNIESILIEYYSNSENNSLEIFPKQKNTLEEKSRGVSNIFYNLGLYKLTLNDIYKVNYNSLNLNLTIGTLLKNDIYLKGCSEKLNINLDYINKDIIEIENWATFYDNNKLLLNIGIKNYTGKNIENVKIYLKTYDDSSSYTIELEKTFKVTFSTYILSIDINENGLKPNQIYKVDRITYNYVGESIERELIEYKKLVDNLDYYDLDLLGNKQQLLRWIITTDLFNEFYNENKIEDYCTLYNTTAELKLKFLEKMIVKFNIESESGVNVSESNPSQPSQDPSVNYIVYSNITIEDEDYMLRNNNPDIKLNYIENYPQEITQEINLNLSTSTFENVNLKVTNNNKTIRYNYELGIGSNFNYYRYDDNIVNNFTEKGDGLIEGLKTYIKGYNFITQNPQQSPSDFCTILIYYLGNHQSGSSKIRNHYFYPVSTIWNKLGPENPSEGKYITLIPDTHERGGDDYHYLIKYLNNSKIGNIKGYSEIGKNNYEYLNSLLFNVERDDPVTFSYKEALLQFSDYLNSKLPSTLIYTYMYIDNRVEKYYKLNSFNSYEYIEFPSPGICISFIKNANDNKWYIADRAFIDSNYSDINYTYYCAKIESGENAGSPYYLSDGNYIYVRPFNCKLNANVKITFNTKEILSYGNLNFKLQHYTYKLFINIPMIKGSETTETFGQSLFDTVNSATEGGSIIKLYIEGNQITGETLDTTKIYKFENNEYKPVNNFYVYNDEGHKINILGEYLNTFVYSFPDNSSNLDKVWVLNDLYDGIAYKNDSDSITRLLFKGTVKTSEFDIQ